MIVDSAIYVNGRRPVEPVSLQEFYEPTEEEFSFVARSCSQEFGLCTCWR
jgi:hypothetical protein